MKTSDLIFGLMASINKEYYTFSDLHYLTSPFDVSEANLRTNLSRMTTSGTLRSIRNGRNATYCFAAKGNRIRSNVSFGFNSLHWDEWDGVFWGVIFSVPDHHAEYRHSIRTKLTRYRFASLFPGFWIRPLHANDTIPSALESILKSGFCRLIRFSNEQKLTPQDARTMWNISEVNDSFYGGISLLEKGIKALHSASPQQALISRMTIGNKIVQLVFKDPMLPPSFLPDDWQGVSIRKQFHQFDSLARTYAEPYWTKIV